MKNKGKVIAIISIIVAVAVAIVITVVVINSNNASNSSENSENGTNSSTNNDSKTAAIVGKWKYDGSDFASANIEFVYTFNADGTGDYNAAGTDMVFTYTTNGNNISIVYSGGPFETEYEINGDILNIKDSGGNDTLYKRVK